MAAMISQRSIPRVTNPTSIAILLRSDMPNLMLDVASEIKKRTGARIHGYVTTKQQIDHYRLLDSQRTFDSLIQQFNILRVIDSDLPLDKEIISEARWREDKFGTTYNSIALTNRHFGRGYALLGPGHPRSRYSERSNYSHLLHGLNCVFRFWESEIRDRGIDLFLATGKEIAVVARSEGIPYRGLYGSRFKNLHFWGDDEFRNSSQIKARYMSLARAQIVPTVDLERPYDLAQVNHATAMEDASLGRALYFIGHQVFRHGYWHLRGYEKSQGYYLTDELRLIWRRYRDWRALAGRNALSVSALSEKPFVFFPLQTEPETSIHQGSPEHFYQHAAIAALSRDLPAGTLIAVKETPYGVGRRPVGFYDQIRAIKNVVLLDIAESGFDVVRAARAVATVVGTAGFEAAVLGKPVISFGRHNIYGCLPHVFVVTDEAKLADHLKKIFDRNFDASTARNEGRRLLQSIVDCSFDLGYYDYRTKSGYNQKNVADCVESLLESLKFEANKEVA
jgi:hypothetical protein